MNNRTFYSPLVVECNSISEMLVAAGHTNNRFVIGSNGVHICISHATHYFVVLNEAYRERAMRWIQMHLKHLGYTFCEDILRLNREAILDTYRDMQKTIQRLPKPRHNDDLQRA